jgi:large subunit ribosomal protein L28
LVRLAVSLKSRHRDGFTQHFFKLRVPMSNVCQVTGRRPTTGFTVSHSHRRNKRWFKPNIQKKKFYVPNEKRHVTLTVSAKGIKIINKRGIESVLADLRRRGEKI